MADRSFCCAMTDDGGEITNYVLLCFLLTGVNAQKQSSHLQHESLMLRSGTISAEEIVNPNSTKTHLSAVVTHSWAVNKYVITFLMHQLQL